MCGVSGLCDPLELDTICNCRDKLKCYTITLYIGLTRILFTAFIPLVSYYDIEGRFWTLHNPVSNTNNLNFTMCVANKSLLQQL